MAFLNRQCRNLLLYGCLLGLALPAPTYAGVQLREQEIRAGLLYNFLKYTDWPPERSANTPLTACILGNSSFGEDMQPMEGRSVNHRQIAFRRVKEIDETSSCHLLFIPAEEKPRWPELRKFLSGKSVLTVSDLPEFARDGGIIGFGREQNHISIELNRDVLRTAKLQVQERMLRLMTVVYSAADKKP